MKLFYAFMFSHEDSDKDKEAIFIVRASNPVSCAKLVEAYNCPLPEFIEPFVTGMIELGIDPYCKKESVLTGPLIQSMHLEQHEHNTYWRRDFQDDDWVNINMLHNGEDYFKCIYTEKKQKML